MTIAATMYRAITFSMLSRYSVYAAKIISLMVLARIFTPDQFGLIASTAVFSVFFQALADFGLAPAVINLRQLSKTDRDGLFSLTLLLGLLFGFGLLAIGAPIASFYKQPSLRMVIPFVSASLVFYSASIMPTALMLRDQRFSQMAIVGVMAEIASTVCAIILAQTWNPLLALASKSLVQAALNFLGLLAFSGKTEFGRPSLGGKLTAIRPLASFSTYQLGFNVVNYFSRNLDNMLVGRYMGPSSLGVYNEAYQVMRYPLMLLTFAMTPAIQPVIAKHADDVDTVRAVHDDFAQKLSLVGAAVAFAMFLLSKWIVVFVLGPQWLDAVPIVRILAIAVPAQVVLSTSGSFFQALSRADLLFKSGLLSALVMVPAIVLGVSQALTALCWYLVAAFYINFVQAYYLLYTHVLKKGFGVFLLKMVPMVIVVLVMASIAWGNPNWLW
ncbi:lipopolysaccharide biosynthesis protein [Lysobacter rhizosphaerae]